jgi:hypothetical protein
MMRVRSLLLALVVAAGCGAAPTRPTPPVPAWGPLPAEVLAVGSSRDLGRALEQVTTLLRRARPMADLGAVAQLAASSIEPSIDLRGPIRIVMLESETGRSRWFALATRRPDQGAPPVTFDERRFGARTLWVASFSDDLVVLTNAPEWVDAHRPVVQAARALPAALDLEVRVAGRVMRWLERTRFDAADEDTPESDDEEGTESAGRGTASVLRSAAAALLAQAESLSVGVRLEAESVLLEARAYGAPGTQLAAIADGAPALEAERVGPVPQGAKAIFVTDLSGDVWTPARVEAARLFASNAPEGVDDRAWAAFGRSLVGRVTFSLQDTPGDAEPTFLLSREASTLAEAESMFETDGEGALPPAHHQVGPHVVRRLPGPEGGVVAEFVHARGRAFVAIGGWARGLVDAMLAGYWADALADSQFGRAFRARPQGTFVFGAFDLPGLIQGIQGRGGATGGPPCVLTVRGEPNALVGQLHVPHAQVIGAARLSEPGSGESSPAPDLEAPIDL